MSTKPAFTTPRKWIGRVPKVDAFGKPIVDQFIDGATKYGPWAFMTPASHRINGLGLGIGRGQRYVRGDDDTWSKVEG